MNPVFSRKQFLAVILIVSFVGGMMGAAYQWSLAGPSANQSSALNQWTGVSPYSYLIFTDGATVYAKNGSTSSIDYSGTDAGTVIQTVETAMETAGGGSLYLRHAVYNTASTELIITKKHIHWNADPGTVIESSLLPAVNVSGTTIDGTLEQAVNDISISNIDFLYTGPDTAGSFIVLHYLQNDYKYQGPIELDGISITGNFSSVPTTTALVGLDVNVVMGVMYNILSVAYFGTGILTEGSGGFVGSSNKYDLLSLSCCRYGFNDSGGFSETAFDVPKVMFTSVWGMWMISGTGTSLVSPQFESTTGSGALMDGELTMTVTEGLFSSVVGTAISTYYGGSYGVFSNNYFQNVNTAIWLQTSSWWVLENNGYGSGISTKVHVEPGAHMLENDSGYP